MGRKLPDKSCNLKFRKTVNRWDEAIPLGNGLSGALIWGKSEGLRFSLDRGDIWDNTPYDGFAKEEFSFPMMVKLAKEKNNDEIRRIFCDPYFLTLPSKLPAGKLIFNFGEGMNVTSELNLARAEATIKVGENICLDAFMHAEKKVGYIRVNKKSSEFSYYIDNPQFGTEEGNGKYGAEQDCVETASLKSVTYKEPEIVKEGSLSYFIQEICEEFSYGIFAKAKETEDGTELVFHVATSNDGENWKENSIAMLDAALETGCDNMKKSHMEWWENYWAKSSITLPDKFFEKNWYLAQYLLASCSRKGCYPMPLQGVWTADDGKLPPWKGDYHMDLNVQMSYYSYLKANHLEEGESLLDYLWEMAECGRKFAKTFFKAKGMCLPPVMSLTGEPLGGWAMYSFSPTNQIWLCQIFERYYRYTGDREFLTERAYPYLKETAAFILDILEERDGKYYLPISCSPEIHDDEIEAFITPNSNYDLALMQCLFEMLGNLADELENGEGKRWREIRAKFPELAVNERDVLMLCPDETLEESHRHHSHAMAVHPLYMISYEGEENRRIIDATIADLERLGTGRWVGFSFGWMAELYAVQRNGNGAAWQLSTFWNNCCSQNGFHLNGDFKHRGTSASHYRPFTLEGNFCAADALQEMLLQTERNTLHFFPAIPDEWLEGTVAFESLRGERGILVSASMTDGELTSVVLKPQYTGTIKIKLTEELKNILEYGKYNLPEWKENGDCIEVLLQGGEEYTIGREVE